MTDQYPSSDVHHQLLQLLDDSAARYRITHHAKAGKCAEVSSLRGTLLGQGAKALVCKVKGNGVSQHVLAVLSAEQQADLGKIALAFSAKKASLASPAEVDALTGCVFGAIPPFSFHSQLTLIADPSLFSQYSEIAFNAASLEKSIILNSEDYLRIARPRLVSFHRQAEEQAFPPDSGS